MSFTNETGSPSNGSNLKESLGNMINPISVDDLEVKSQESEQKISAELLSSLVKGIKDIDITPQSTENLILNQEERVKSLELEDLSNEVCLDVPNLTDRYCESEVVTVSSDNIPTIKELGSSKIEDNSLQREEDEEHDKILAFMIEEDTKDRTELAKKAETEDVHIIKLSDNSDLHNMMDTQDDSLVLDLDDACETLNIEEFVTDKDIKAISEDVTTISDSIHNDNNPSKEGFSSINFGDEYSSKTTSNSTIDKPKRKRRKKKRSTSGEVLKAIDVIEHMDDEAAKKEKEVDEKLDSMANIMKESKKAMQKKNVEKQNEKVEKTSTNNKVTKLDDIWSLYSDEEKSNLRELDAKQDKESAQKQDEDILTETVTKEVIAKETVSNTEPKSIDAEIAVDTAIEKLESETTAVDLLTSSLPNGMKEEIEKKSNSKLKKKSITTEDSRSSKGQNESAENKEINEFDKALNGLVTNIALEIWDEEFIAVPEEDNIETSNFVKDFLQGIDPRIVENNGDEYYEILTGLTERVISDGSNFFEVTDNRLKNLDISKFTQNIYKLIINEKVYYLFKEIPKHLMAHRQKYLKTKLGMIKALTEESKLADSVNLKIPKTSRSTSLPVFTESEIKAIKDTLREDFIITKETQTGIYAMYRTFL